MPRRSAEHAGETRLALMQAARQRFAGEGFKASLASIVTDAGLTKGALFHHFDHKLALFQSVWTDLQTGMDAEARAAARAAMRSDDPYAQLLAGSRVYLKWAARPDYFKIVLFEGPAVLGMQGWYESDHDLGRRNVRRSVEFLARNGRIDPIRVETYTILIQSALNGIGFALGQGTNSRLTPETAHEAFEIFLRGLR